MITNSAMDNKQKKEYTAPKMEVIEYKRESDLLSCSGEDPDSCMEVRGW